MASFPPIPMPRSARPGGYPAAPSAPMDYLSMIRGGLGRNANALIGLGTNLMSAPGSQGFAAAGQGWAQGNGVDLQRQQLQQQQDEQNATRDWVKANFPQYAGLPPAEGWQAAMKDMAQKQAGPVDPTTTYQGRLQIGKEQGLTGVDLVTFALTDKLPGGNQTARAGVGQPVYFQNSKTKEIRAVQPMTTGAGQDMLTGDTLPGDPSEWNVVDPITMAGQKAGVVVDEKTSGAARAALPGAEQAYAVTQQTLTQLASPGGKLGEAEQFGNTFGVPNQWLQGAAVRPGSPMANYRNIIDQLSGQAFLQIRQALKGAGQVTDFEGTKGELAISRMKAAAEKGDSTAFDQAVVDFQTAIDNGMRLLRAQANNDYQQGQPAVTGQPAPAPQGAPDLKTKYGLE